MSDEIYIVTDDCMWEANKQEGTRAPHAIGVVNEKTGEIRYIRGGSRIAFVSGEITEIRTQEAYNELHAD